MNGVKWTLCGVLVVMTAILAILSIQTFGPKPVCHSNGEWADITDCSYHNGTWSTK